MASFKTFHVSNLTLTVAQVILWTFGLSRVRYLKKRRCGPTRFPTLIWKAHRSAVWWIEGDQGFTVDHAKPFGSGAVVAWNFAD